MSNESLATYYAGWDRYQDLLVTAVAPLTSEQLALRAAPNQRPAWTIVAHIIAARVWWFHSIMGEGDASLASLQTWDDDGQPQRSAAELEEGLERTWGMINHCLKRWTAADFGQQFVRRDETLSRQWIIWHVIEHDMNHGGELFLTLGIHGLPTPDL
ncbi:MAG TPA: DinB family protein [Ktedonobacterales bacterium]|jgi:uncharacterized damage-inducible protein DinB|nr:DinB family protein [Ktedonobacterales bacterium]